MNMPPTVTTGEDESLKVAEKISESSHDFSGVARDAVRATLDYDAYADLGGRLPSIDPELPQEDILELMRVRGVPVAYAELHQFLQLSLDILSPESIKGMSFDDKKLVAFRAHELMSTMQSRIKTLPVAGNYTHPAFAHYDFSDDTEASHYVELLKNVLAKSSQLPGCLVLNDIFDKYVKGPKRLAYYKSISKNSKTYVDIDNNTQVVRVYSEAIRKRPNIA